MRPLRSRGAGGWRRQAAPALGALPAALTLLVLWEAAYFAVAGIRDPSRCLTVATTLFAAGLAATAVTIWVPAAYWLERSLGGFARPARLACAGLAVPLLAAVLWAVYGDGVWDWLRHPSVYVAPVALALVLAVDFGGLWRSGTSGRATIAAIAVSILPLLCVGGVLFNCGRN